MIATSWSENDGHFKEFMKDPQRVSWERVRRVRKVLKEKVDNEGDLYYYIAETKLSTTLMSAMLETVYGYLANKEREYAGDEEFLELVKKTRKDMFLRSFEAYKLDGEILKKIAKFL